MTQSEIVPLEDLLMEQPTTPRLLKFGPYLVDLAAGEIRKNGLRIRLQEKPLRVLELLAENQGQVVTRDDLRKRLWPEDTFVDFETGLNTAVSKLRDALSDSAEKPRFIETIPRRGYRFLSSAEFEYSINNEKTKLEASPTNGRGSTDLAQSRPQSQSLESSTQLHVADHTHEQIRQIRSTSVAWVRGTIMAAGLLLLATVWWLTPLPDPRITEIFKVTQSGHMDYQVRPATDGARIFYVQRAGDHYELMQASTNGGEEQKLNAPLPNTLVWDVTPDGHNYLITSFTRRGEPSPLWSWPATGGAPVKIGDILSGSASYSPDGKQLVYHIKNDLLAANADGTGIRKLASFEKEEPDSPVWSPDGKVIRFNRNDPQRDTLEIWEINVDGSNLHAVLPGWQEVPRQCCGTWTPDGRYFIFVDSSQYVSRLCALREKPEWWRRSPRGPFLLASEATGSWSPLVSRDGNHVYFYGITILSDTELLDLKTQQFSAIFHDIHPSMLSVSPDGKWVSFIRAASGVLWTSHFDGSDAKQIPLRGMRAAFPRFSPDNRRIAFTGLKIGAAQRVYVVDASGGTPTAVGRDAIGLSDPDWAPDGESLVVDQDLQPRKPNQASSSLAFVDLNNGHIAEVPGSEDLHMPRWSHDGRTLAAVRGSRNEILTFDMKSQIWKTVARGKSLSFPVWSADGADLYYQDVLAPGQPLYLVHLENGAVSEIASFQKALDTGIGRCAFVGLSPEGAPMISFDRSSSDIYGAHISLP
jgi:DNA-binding winged helix-turn-helix (wHTH) protein/Tol biopolymer transport system component